ncbi:hypothetical protein CCR75_005474 [Bremia lactucae]|uniref:Uncharacterized protein n=1 Tax=Bremia lactucae TaxID=4779 RepID=A0A976FJJ6_BRELC|nr:hypothetical protein CCR75_005474 [Bremia lactucae]
MATRKLKFEEAVAVLPTLRYGILIFGVEFGPSLITIDLELVWWQLVLASTFAGLPTSRCRRLV